MTRRATFRPRRFRPLVQLFNSIGPRIGRWSGYTNLSEESILEAATERYGIEGFGDESFHEPLRVLLRAYREEPGLPFLKRALVREDVLWSLGQRMETIKAFARDPEIGSSRIDRSIFITGFPRTGTTALHQLLTLDPSRQWLRLRDLMSVVPLPGKDGRDTRPDLASRYLRYIDWAFPELRIVHPIDTTGPVEDFELSRRSFISPSYLLDADLPAYRTWFAEQSVEVRAEAYRFHKIQLQILQRDRPVGRTWLHKSPTHLGQLDALLHVYPDARIILTHRDPVDVVPSFCSLVSILRSRIGVSIDPVRLGESLTAILADAQEAARRVLSRCDRSQICAVGYEAIVRSPADAVRSIYEHFGDPVPEGLDDRIGAWSEDHRRNRRGVHRYSLAQFGLEADELRRRLRWPSRGGDAAMPGTDQHPAGDAENPAPPP